MTRLYVRLFLTFAVPSIVAGFIGGRTSVLFGVSCGTAIALVIDTLFRKFSRPT